MDFLRISLLQKSFTFQHKAVVDGQNYLDALLYAYPDRLLDSQFLERSRNLGDTCYFILELTYNWIMENKKAFCFSKSKGVEIDFHASCRSSFYFDRVDFTIKLLYHSILLGFLGYKTILSCFFLGIDYLCGRMLLKKTDCEVSNLTLLKWILN